MTESKNRQISFQEMFVRFVLFIFTYPLSAWFLSGWFRTPYTELLSFLLTALVGFLSLPFLKRLGVLRYSIIVAVITASLVPMYLGKFWFEGSRIWGGFALAVLGAVSFASNWIYLRVMSEVSDSAGDIMSQRSYLILSALVGASMILMGAAVALGILS